ncbi:response regulator [Devosia sp. MC1541]|uniref:response regulator n=1 Tax=Devosia sp. MC1541 TaxID=2725264 RepID=UPI00145D8180|nr:response regulator [Devosia sp. MC1541]
MNENNAFGGRRVLVVEDDVLLVADLIDQLQALGADVVGPVLSVEDALAHTNDIAAAVLDVSVGGEMIFPVAEELDRHRIPYVFTTGYRDADLPEPLTAPVFTKPIHVAGVIFQLQMALVR